MTIKLIVTDLDRTLLRTDKSISDYTISVFEKCKEKGIMTAIATARSETAARRYIEWINPDMVLSCGGALARLDDRIIYKSILPAVVSDQLICELLYHPNVGDLTVDTDNGYYVSYSEPADHPDYIHGIYNDFKTPLGKDVYKITVEIFDDNTANYFADKYKKCSMIRFSGESWCRFANKNADKAIALRQTIGQMNISVSEAVVFGDDFNDIDMLRECGIGVAVDNAIAEAKDAANFICNSNDNDGVAAWIEKNIL